MFCSVWKILDYFYYVSEIFFHLGSYPKHSSGSNINVILTHSKNYLAGLREKKKSFTYGDVLYLKY